MEENNVEKKEEDCCKPAYNEMTSIRVFALIIIGVVLIAGALDVWSNGWPSTVIVTMGLMIFVWSFQPLFRKNKKLAKWLILALSALLVLGMIVLFAFQK